MPGKIISTQYVSLDGVMEDPVGMEGSGLGDWTGPFTRGPEGDKFKVEELFSAKALLFGRVTYDAFAAVWPTVKDEAGYADRMNALPKYLASSRGESAGWSHTQVLGADLTGEAKRLKGEINGEILIFGSTSVVHQLQTQGLIDEYRLMIFPTVLGRGNPQFAPGGQIGLSLIENRRFSDGIVLLRYKVR
jgi:dihydrofolate reductase